MAGLSQFPMSRLMQCLMLEQHVESPLIGLCVVTAATQVQLVTGSNGQPTTAILTGAGAQAAFQNAAGQLVVVTNNSPGSVTIPLNSNGDPSIPSGADVTVVSNNPSVPSTSSSSPPTGWLASLSEAMRGAYTPSITTA